MSVSKRNDRESTYSIASSELGPLFETLEPPTLLDPAAIPVLMFPFLFSEECNKLGFVR